MEHKDERMEKREPPRYEHLPTKDAPTGYAMFINMSDASTRHGALLLPINVGKALQREGELAMLLAPPPASASGGHKTATSVGRAEAAPAPAPAFGARRNEHVVDMTAFGSGWPKPPGLDWVQVWQPQALRALVVAHNAGMGSADRADQARDAAMFRKILELGPWRRCAAPCDVQTAVRALSDEFGHLQPVVDFLADRLALSEASEQPFVLPPILLVGPPGVGKTYFASRLAEILKVPMRAIDMGGQQTNSHLHGSDRHWGNSRAGVLFELLVLCDTGMEAVANPVLVLDELDKVSRNDDRYNPMAPLHAALEPITARRTRDLCNHVVFDASRVIYVATANSLRGLPDPLLSRFRMFYCGPADLRQGLRMAQAIAQRVIDDAGLAREFEPIEHALLVRLAEHTPRAMVQRLTEALARAVAAGRFRMELRDLDPTAATRVLH